MASWTPIIRERRFVPWLVGEPTREEQQESVPITTSQIYRLEDLWKAKPSATLVDLENPEDAEDDVSHVELQYTDGKHLMNVLGPLVKVRELLFWLVGWFLVMMWLSFSYVLVGWFVIKWWLVDWFYVQVVENRVLVRWAGWMDV